MSGGDGFHRSATWRTQKARGNVFNYTRSLVLIKLIFSRTNGEDRSDDSTHYFPQSCASSPYSSFLRLPIRPPLSGQVFKLREIEQFLPDAAHHGPTKTPQKTPEKLNAFGVRPPASFSARKECHLRMFGYSLRNGSRARSRFPVPSVLLFFVRHACISRTNSCLIERGSLDSYTEGLTNLLSCTYC